MNTPDDYTTRTRRHLRAIAEDASQQLPLMAPLEMREVCLRVMAALRVVWRCHPRLPDPDECERAILELLYERGQLRAAQIVAAIEENFSPATIYRRLAKMTGLDVIRCSRETPRGYDLDPWLRGQADACAANSA